jgi:large subunit ribosomal protein L3
MPNPHHPHRGSMQFWPRARSRKHSARVRTWAEGKDAKVEGFLGYKIGMTHVYAKENRKKHAREGMDVFTPCTVIECPPMKVYAIRFYRRDEDYGDKIISEVFAKKTDKELKRKLHVSKKDNKVPEEFDYLRLVVYSQPKLTGLGKKKPDMIEVNIGGSKEDALAKAQELMDKEIRVADVFKEGVLIDVHGVTKGQGFSGVVKKFGVKTLQHKAEKTKRGIGTMGAWTTKKVQYTVPQPGKFGYHLRTEYNKKCLKISDKPEEVNPKGGFVRVGVVKNDYILIEGSVVGSRKRPITLTDPIRAERKKNIKKDVTYISLESRQR